MHAIRFTCLPWSPRARARVGGRGAIASIRAVNVDSVVRTLLGRGLITEVGQDPVTTATLYGTSEVLLGHLGLGDVSELPPIAPLLEDGSEGFDHEQF